MKGTEPRSEPFEPDSFDAKEALTKGDAELLARYLDELGQNLQTIGELLAPKGDEPPRLSFIGESSASPADHVMAGDEEPDDEWTGSTSQLRAAIDQRNAPAVGSFLCETAELVERLQRVIGPDKSSSEPWQLVLKRRRAGRPKDPIAAMNEETAIATRVRLGWGASTQREATVTLFKEATGKSRATTFRKLARSKGRNAGN